MSHFEYTLFLFRLFLANIWKYDVTHEAQRIATLPEEDRVTDFGNVGKNGKDWMCSFGDMLTHAGKQPYSSYQCAPVGPIYRARSNNITFS